MRSIQTLRCAVISSLCAIAAIAATALADPVKSAGKIEAVTVYRGRALVTRAVETTAPAGPVELVVTDLPAQIVPDSLFASADGAQVRAVRYRTQALQDEPREDLRKLEQQIDEVQKSLRKNQSTADLLRQKEAYLANLEAFTAAKVKEDMAKATLNAETVKNVTEFVFQQRTDLNTSTLALTEEQRANTQKLELLQRQREELTRQFTRTAREAVVFLDKGPNNAVVRLNYLVSSAGWAPMYNLRSAGAGKELTLEYNALVQQMSGEDWPNVKVTLSTASAAMAAEAPMLTPMWVTLGGSPAGLAIERPEDLYRGQREAGENLRRAVEQTQAHAATRPSVQVEESFDTNRYANELQILDLVAGKDALLASRPAAAADSVLSVNYVLPSAISIPSRSDQQMIQIAAPKLQGEYYYLATPLLTPYVYEQADIVNTSDIALLAGPVSTYMDGEFMGTGQIPMVAKGQRFTVGFGVDSQLRTGREVADKTDRVQGGNRELTFKYRLLVDNYKDKAVKVRLVDRLPDPRTPEIRVTLSADSEKALSADAVYQRALRKEGILRWEVDVPAKSSGASAKTVEYEYKIEFDKNMHLTEPSAVEQEKDKARFREQLEMMQRAR